MKLKISGKNAEELQRICGHSTNKMPYIDKVKFFIFKKSKLSAEINIIGITKKMFKEQFE